MIKKLTRTAKVKIMPKDNEGNSAIKVYAREVKEVELDLCMDYSNVMRLLSDLLMENQVADLRKRLYKH